MKRPSLILATALLATAAGTPAGSADTNPYAAMGQHHIGTLSLHRDSFCLDAAIRKKLDSLLPRLKSLEPASIIKIEGISQRGGSREEQVRNSLYLAMEAQKYLKRRHGLKNEMYLAAAPVEEGETTNSIRITVFPDAFSAVHVSSANGSSE